MGLQTESNKLVEECMPTLERFEVVEKQVFFPIPKPVGFTYTIRIYASTMSREAVRNTLAQIREVVEGAELTNDELYQCSLLSEDDCKEIEELHKSYGDDIFYGEDDFARHRFAGDIVVRRKITQAHTKAILKAIEGG